ncbi:MAG: type II secretion system protein [Candidatus Taylorbacteria bacterium]|nr:type II secretion system protein [Candidatus Taylorbacteria bacterium]
MKPFIFSKAIGNKQMKPPFSNHQAGFTLSIIELVVIAAIIGLLATFAVVNIGQVKLKAKDSKSLADLGVLQVALARYYNVNKHYPKLRAESASIDPFADPGEERERTCGRLDNDIDPVSGLKMSWCVLMDLLKPYLPNEVGTELAPEEMEQGYFRYDSNSGDGYQTFGLALWLLGERYRVLAENDGGYTGCVYKYYGYESFLRCWYEVGYQPAYCKNKYSSTDEAWTFNFSSINPNYASLTARVCRGGN